jgi:hypothetical protein
MSSRLIVIALLLLGAALSSGCVRSLHPIYTEQTLTYDPAFLGTWVDETGETRIEIAPAADNEQPDTLKSYRIIHTDKDAKPAHLIGYLAKVGDLLVADLTISEQNALPESDFAKAHLFPLHTFWIIRHGDDKDAAAPTPTMTLRAISHDWLKNFINDHPDAIGSYKSNDDVILTAPPEALQKFLLAHAKDEGMLSDAAIFRRTKPPAPAATAPSAATTAPGKPTAPAATPLRRS